MNFLSNLQHNIIDETLDFFQVVFFDGELYLDECGLSRYFGEFVESLFMDSNYETRLPYDLDIEDHSVRYYSLDSILDYVDDFNYPTVIHNDVCELFKQIAEQRISLDNSTNFRYYFEMDFETKYPYLVNSDNFVEVELSTLKNQNIIDTYYDSHKNAIEIVCDTGKSYRLQYQNSIKNDKNLSTLNKQKCDMIYGESYANQYCKNEYQYTYDIDYDSTMIGQVKETSYRSKYYDKTYHTICTFTNTEGTNINYKFSTNNVSKYVSLVEYIPYTELEISYFKNKNKYTK